MRRAERAPVELVDAVDDAEPAADVGRLEAAADQAAAAFAQRRGVSGTAVAERADERVVGDGEGAHGRG
jgi:hypothetical protein